MRKQRRNLSTCKDCGNSLGHGSCGCQKLTLKGRMPMNEGAFYQPFIFIARQFMDFRSHMALMATCQNLYDLYQNFDELSRSANHFAFPIALKPEYRHEMGWHRNPVIARHKNITLRLLNGVLSKSLSQDVEQYSAPAIIKTQDGFNPVTLPNNLQGRIAGVVYRKDYFIIWTDNEILMTNVRATVLAHDIEPFRFFNKLNASSEKILTIKPFDQPILLTDASENNIRMTGKPNDVFVPLNARCVDAVSLQGGGFLFLTEQGSILAYGDIRHDFNSQNLPVANYDNLTPVFAEVTAREKIIGIASGNGYVVAWSNKNIFTVGRTHPYFSQSDHLENFSWMVLPKMMGEIVQVKAGRDHILLLDVGGNVYSAGFNYAKQLGRKLRGGFTFFDGGHFDYHFKKIEGLPNAIVSIQCGEYALNQNLYSEPSAFLTHNGKVFLCGTKSSPRDYFTGTCTDYSGFTGAP